MSTDDILARARAALDGVTDGPWEAEWSSEQGNCVIPSDAESTRESVCVTRLYHQAADAEFIAWAREGVPELVARVELLQRGGRELGRIVHRLTDDHLAAIGEKLGGDLIDADGDGHWDIVHERLMALRPERDEARAQIERLRAQIEQVRGMVTDSQTVGWAGRPVMHDGTPFPVMVSADRILQALDGEA